jgi:drug/metabolite transporter (DMT)-like permease
MAGENKMFAMMFGLFAAVCWSVHDLVARKFANAIGPYRMAVATMLTGSLILSGLVLWNGTLMQADGASLRVAMVLGVIYGIAVASLFKAFSLAPVSIVGPFTAGYPALVVMWGLYNGVYPSLIQYVAIMLILGGAVVVGRMGPDDGGLGTVAKGKIIPMIFFCVMAVVCFAASVVLGQIASATLGEIETTFLSRLPAALFILPFAFMEKPAESKISSSAWLGIAAMALLDVAAVCGINYMGRLPNKEFGAMGISAYGAIAVLLAMIILKEKVAPWQWLGIAMIVFGVGVLSWSN